MDKKELLLQAKKLASSPYSVAMQRDETTKGSPIYLFSHPELPGCMAQGKTIQEASDALAEARLEYLMSLLEDGAEIPKPALDVTMTIWPIVTEFAGLTMLPTLR